MIAKYHLTLGQLIKRLDRVPGVTKILTADGQGIEGLCSYRGYYSDLALNPVGGPVWTADQLLREAKFVINTELTGYKGGEFLMTKDTPLWLARYGGLGPAIMDLTPDGVLVTRDLDEED
jgi:hypothetical protein